MPTDSPDTPSPQPKPPAVTSPVLPAEALTNDTLVILDTETTGLDPRTEQLLELGAVKLVDGVVVDTFSMLINPGQPIRPSSIKIHHITEDMIVDAPAITEVLPRFLEFLGDMPYAAHNVAFDYGFIKEACKVHLRHKFKNLRICTQEMFKVVFPEDPSHGLSALMDRFGQPSLVNHRALDDAAQLASVYPRLRALYKQKLSWQYSQLDNVHYLVERYLRLQKAAHVLQSEMADLKDIFRLHFAEGGLPITASSGEQLTAQWRRHFEFEEEQLMNAVQNAGLMHRVCKVNIRQLDRLITDRADRLGLSEEQLQDLAAARVAVGQTLHVAFQKAEVIATEPTLETLPIEPIPEPLLIANPLIVAE